MRLFGVVAVAVPSSATLLPGDPPQATASAATAAVATIAAKKRMRSMIARPDNSPRSGR